MFCAPIDWAALDQRNARLALASLKNINSRDDPKVIAQRALVNVSANCDPQHLRD